MTSTRVPPNLIPGAERRAGGYSIHAPKGIAMGRSVFRRLFHRQREEEEPAAIAALRERARAVADAIHSDNSARWFPVGDVFPIYTYLYDYFRRRPDDMRMRRLAQDALARLQDTAKRLERTAVNPLPPEWDQAKAALGETAEVFDALIRPW